MRPTRNAAGAPDADEKADIEAGTNIIQATGSTKVMIRPPKYNSERTVYLPDELIEILAEHIVTYTPDGDPDRWLFADKDRPWHDNSVTWRWRGARTSAGLATKLHDLRHYYASGLIAAGCDVVTVQRALGHAAATTTLNTYSHLWPTAEDKTRAAASDMAKQALAGPSTVHTPCTRGAAAVAGSTRRTGACRNVKRRTGTSSRVRSCLTPERRCS